MPDIPLHMQDAQGGHHPIHASLSGAMSSSASFLSLFFCLKKRPSIAPQYGLGKGRKTDAACLEESTPALSQPHSGGTLASHLASPSSPQSQADIEEQRRQQWETERLLREYAETQRRREQQEEEKRRKALQEIEERKRRLAGISTAAAASEPQDSEERARVLREAEERRRRRDQLEQEKRLQAQRDIEERKSRLQRPGPGLGFFFPGSVQLVTRLFLWQCQGWGLH